MRFCLIMSLFIGFFACEQPFTPPLPEGELELVVEGYIEGGESATPPYVLLTRSQSFFAELDAETLENLFVRDAEVLVREGSTEVQLTEFCLDELSDSQKALAAQFLGLSIDDLAINLCIYTDLSGQMVGEIGKTYQLEINAEGKTLSAVTIIPPNVQVDSLFFVPPPGAPNDTLAQARLLVQDPGGEANFYRYFTEVNGGGFQAPFPSVADDRLFDGQFFELPLSKAEDRDAEFDIATNGLFTRGDSVCIKWTNLDEAHFDFWNTVEFNAANQGPFSSYTRVDHNIEGGIGIWGGYSTSFYCGIADY